MDEDKMMDAPQNKITAVASAEEQDFSMWYEQLSLEDAEVFIRSNLVSAARNVIAIGYYLKHIRDNELYLQAGYDTIWDYASDQYGFSKSTTSRYMSRNDKFSKDGNSPVLDARYQGFSKAQLQEMLSLDQEQLEQVTPDMTVAQIREMRKPKEVPYYPIEGQMEIGDFLEQEEPEIPALPERQVFALTVDDLMGEEDTCDHDAAETQQNGDICCENSSDENVAVATPQQVVSAYGTSVRVWPEDSLLTTPGCEGGHDCFSCAMECRIRQEDRWCREASCGNPFPCDMLRNSLEDIRETIGNNCEFINHDLAYHLAGNGEAYPCCKHCSTPCEFICSRVVRELKQKPEQSNEEAQSVVEDSSVADAEVENELSDIELLQKMLEKENELLDEMIKVDSVEKLPKNMLRKKKLLVAALASMLCDLDMPDPEEPEQPEFPVMKNNDQRKAWLKTFHDWPVWFEVPEASEVYYRYDLPDGSSLVICEYRQWLEWKEKWSDENPDSVGVREYLLNPGYHYLHDCHTNRTAMIEKLKEVQKKGRDDEKD